MIVYNWLLEPKPRHCGIVHIVSTLFWQQNTGSESLLESQTLDSALPLVTIITPSYNQGAFIRETIESVLSQDYPNLEYWIIDGGSTDNSVEIIREYANDPRVHWLSEPDKGQADAVNKGFLRAQGEIIGWLNSDDTFYPGAIRRQVEQLCLHPNVGVVYGDAQFIDENGKSLRTYLARPFDRKSFLYLSVIPQPSAFIRRSLITKHGGLDTSLQYALDYDFFLRLMWHTEFLYNHETIATYRLHSASKTVDGVSDMMRESIAVVEATCEAHAEQLGVNPDKVLSDWYWSAAIRCIEAGDWFSGYQNAVKAINKSWFRPRSFTFVLTCIDTCIGTNLVEAFIHWRHKNILSLSK